MDVLDLCRELVSIESTSSREGRVAAVIADRLRADGWHVITQPVEGGDPEMKETRVNVLAVDHPDVPPRVVLTTHIDTVPPYFGLTEDSEFLYGRGTCDAKGIFAAQWVAAQQLRDAGEKGVALLAVVGEETDSIGAKNVRSLLPSTNWIIDGEPTQMKMTSAAKGVLALRLRASGVVGHSAYPERGRSAVHSLIAAIGRVLGEALPSEEAFGETTVNIGTIEGGLAGNVLAPSAEALAVVRLAAPLETIKAEILARLGDEISAEVLTASDPLLIHVPDGYESAPVSFGSDVPHLSPIGTPLLVGPGSIHDAHTRGEKIGKKELADSVPFYADLTRRLLDADRDDPSDSVPS